MRRSLFDMGCKRDVSLQEFFDARHQVAPSGCWMWTGKVGRSFGYGEIRRKRGTKTMKAHRVSYELYKGPIPDEMCVCHTCDVPLCVNPAHLWLGTREDNNKDKTAKGRNVFIPRRGEGSATSKLTEKQALDIKADLRTQSKIAKDYGISQCAVSDIKTGRRWKHLP